MKTKLLLRTSAVICAILMPLSATVGQNGLPPAVAAAPGAPGVSPATHLPTAPPTIDPTTGLLEAAPNEWKDPGWRDPERVLTNVSYDGLPISEVAHIISDQFKAEFDLLLPHDYGANRSSSDPTMENVDWLQTPVHLRLNNVKASEVFNAMNLLFENNRTALRWELKLNGSRRVALLRVTEDSRQMVMPIQVPKRMVYFVGDLISPEKTGGMVDIVNTISEVWKMTYGQSAGIQFHDKAQLLIVTGTDDQNEFIRQTLQAMRSKAQMEHSRQRQVESKTNDGELKVQIR